MKRVVALVVAAAVLSTQQSCGTSTVPVDLKAGEIATSRVSLHSEPEKRLEWSGATDCHLTFSKDRTVVLESDAASGKLDLRPYRNVDLVIKVRSKRTQQIDPVIEYSFLGMAPDAVTVKKRIQLKK